MLDLGQTSPEREGVRDHRRDATRAGRARAAGRATGAHSTATFGAGPLKVASHKPLPLWFGPERSPLFGVLHLPENSARGAVVICPPIGREYSSSHSTFVRLATELAALGIAALRFDYRSTGDSFDRLVGGSDGAGFEQDVRSAVDFVRKMEVAHLGIVGMRLGANFAAAQCCVEPVDALVLWDACPSGRSFLREQRALGLLAGLNTAPSPPGAIEVPSYKLTPEMTEEISSAGHGLEQGWSWWDR